MVSADLWSKIESRIALPPLPRTTARLRELTSDDDVDVSAVAEVINADPALVVKVLAYANSSYFGLQEEVRSIERATMTLGLSSVYNLVLQTELFDTFAHVGSDAFELEAFWRHCVLVAQLCRDMHPRCTPLDGEVELQPDELYTCGLLHDIGKVTMAATLGAEFTDVLAETRGRPGSSVHLEQREFGYTHAEVGAMIAQIWGLPRQIGDAIESHHLPRVRLRDQPYSTAVALGDELAHLAGRGEEIDPMHYSTNPFYRYLGLSFEETGALVETAGQYRESIELH